tara:strand:+ start:5165 stop:5626 length:462 start_codon:yes stop_codon:yes gene_type:complete
MNYESTTELIENYMAYNIVVAVAELELVIKNMIAAGATQQAIRLYLLQDLKDGGRIFGTLSSAIVNNTTIGITGASQIAQWLTYEQAGVTEFMWVTVSKNPCFQCKGRAGRIETKEYWTAAGLPRSGFSICRGNCKCHLEPIGYSGESTVILD